MQWQKQKSNLWTYICFPKHSSSCSQTNLFYTVVGSRAKTSHVSRRICLSPGQVNQAVSSALFHFRWDSNSASRQFNNYQPSKYNSCISHLSFRQVIKSVTYQQCLLRFFTETCSAKLDVLWCYASLQTNRSLQTNIHPFSECGTCTYIMREV